MSSWFEEQITERGRLDDAALEDAYARLAASVLGARRAPRFMLDDAIATDDAISSILHYYGAKPKHLPESITDPSERIEYSLASTGIMKRPVALKGKWWKDATGAFLGYLKDGGPVALIPTGVRGYGYIDPSTHKKVKVNAKTADLFIEEALCFYRPLPSHELSIRDVLYFMAASLDWNDYFFMLFSMAVSTLLGMLPIQLTNLLYKQIIPSGLPALILPIASMMIGVLVAQTSIKMTSSLIITRLSEKLDVQMEAATMARVFMLPTGFFKDYSPGDLTNRVMAMTQFVQTISQNVITTTLSALFSLVYIGQMLTFAPSLALPALLVVIAEVFASTLITFSLLKYNRKSIKAHTKLSGVTPSILNAMTKIKVAGAEKRAFAQWAHTYSEAAAADYDRPTLIIASAAIVPFIGAIGTVILYYLAATTGVSAAAFMTFSGAYGTVAGAIATLAGLATTFAQMRPMLELIEPIMKAIPEATEAKRRVESVNGSIEVSHLSFRYNETSPLVLNDISLRISPGEYVAIVGATGCGKSTFLRCLLGFETPEKGAIYYGGQDITSVDVRSLRKQIGVVMQQSGLFAGDILSNITISSPKAGLDEAWEAAEMAGIADDIQAMPMGMQTIVSEGGGGLSGGQRQRLMIARAVCNKPRILMLDEATSALDNLTQRHVSDALASLDCTRIIIAHRLSTIRHADRIILLDSGKIAEDGTYEELIAKKGKFAELVERQRLEGE